MLVKFDELLQYRDELQHAARLANLAYAYQWLSDFADRIQQAGLSGEVALRGPAPIDDRLEAKLIALDFNQSVLEEHFLPDEIEELHNVFAAVHEVSSIVEAKFRLEQLHLLYLPALRRALEVANVLPRKQASPLFGSSADAR